MKNASCVRSSKGNRYELDGVLKESLRNIFIGALARITEISESNFEVLGCEDEVNIVQINCGHDAQTIKNVIEALLKIMNNPIRLGKLIEESSK